MEIPEIAKKRGRPAKKVEVEGKAVNPQIESRLKDRIPVGVRRNKMLAPNRKGYLRRWVNDDPGRIKAFLDGGWRFVKENISIGEGPGDGNTSLGSNIEIHVGRDMENGSLRAKLMEIPQKYYDEDQSVKMAAIDVIDNAIKGGDLHPHKHHSGSNSRTFAVSNSINTNNKMSP